MTTQQEEHLKKVKDSFNNEVDRKYRAGQAQHGGNLWLKKDLIGKALEEIIDLYVYMATLKEQIEQQTVYDVTDDDIDIK
ncbi:MAG: hypothetical protein EOL97_14210 [Spirochaetia bacterium]|nr:hypothetical protein [Spirochaetia bacterium]